MAGKKSYQRGDKRFMEQLRRLLLGKPFQECLIFYRTNIGIPKNGFISNKEYKKWLNINSDKFSLIYAAGMYICEEFKLPYNYALPLEARLVMGEKWEQYNTIPPPGYVREYDNPDSHCSWELSPDYECAIIKVMPGATARSVKDSVDRNFSKVKSFLGGFAKKAMPIRKTGKTDRDKKILQLRKKGVLNARGEVARSFWTSVSPQIERETLGPDLLKMDPEARNFVINKEKRMRR